LDLGNLTIHGDITVVGSILNLATQLASVIDTTLHTVGGYLGLNPNSSPTLAGLNVNGGLTINAPSQTGITLGNGTLYWQTATNPHVLEMNCGLIIDQSLNCRSISLNPNAGNPAISSNSSAVVCSNLNADLLDGHHASDFLTAAWNGGTITAALTSTLVASGVINKPFVWNPSDISGAEISFQQGTSTSGAFLPTLTMRPKTSNMWGLWMINTQSGEDSGSHAVAEIRASINGGSVSTRPLLSITNNGTNKLTLDASGNLSTAGYLSVQGHFAVGNYGGNSTYIGSGDNGYFYDDGTVYLGKSDNSKTVHVRGPLQCGAGFLTSGWHNYADTSNSEISNDTNSYKCLMIVGNSSDDSSTRKVAIWDYLKVNGSQLVTGNLTSYGDITASGALYTGAIVQFSSGNEVATRFSWVDNGVLAVQQYTQTGHVGTFAWELATVEASNCKIDHLIGATTSRIYTYADISPATNNTYNLGGDNLSGNPPYFGSMWANYLRYHSNNQAFDALDDLTLVKNYKTKTVNDQEVIDIETSLPFLIDDNGFHDPSRDVGFLLGCMKFEVMAREKTDSEVEQLQAQVISLQQQIKQLTENRGD
jgi:hypothetical protein